MGGGPGPDFKPPPATIQKSVGHQRAWIEAALANDPAAVGAPFHYGALLTETALLGTLAYRAGQTLEWDATNMRFPNALQAETLLAYPYRPGWKL